LDNPNIKKLAENAGSAVLKTTSITNPEVLGTINMGIYVIITNGAHMRILLIVVDKEVRKKLS
jgi:hypothetical protein